MLRVGWIKAEEDAISVRAQHLTFLNMLAVHWLIWDRVFVFYKSASDFSFCVWHPYSWCEPVSTPTSRLAGTWPPEGGPARSTSRPAGTWPPEGGPARSTSRPLMSWICFRIVWGSGLKVSVSELRLTSWQLLMLGDGYTGGNYAGLLKLKSWVLV